MRVDLSSVTGLAWLEGVVAEAALESCKRARRFRSGVCGEPCASPTGKYLGADVGDERVLDAHERVGSRPHLDVVLVGSCLFGD